MLLHNPKGYLKYDLLILNRKGTVTVGASLTFILIGQMKIHLRHLQSTIGTLVLFPINQNYKYQLVNQPIHLLCHNSSVILDFGHFDNHNLL